MESVNDEDAEAKRLGISNVNDIGLYTATPEELSILIRVVSSFVRNPNKPAPFLAPTINTNTKIFLEKLRAVFVHHCTDSALEFVEFFNTPTSHTCMTGILLFHLFFSGMLLRSYDPKDKKRGGKARLEGRQRSIIRKV